MSDSAQAGEDAAKDTLSQLFARILGQLSVSAWLPAAALVLTLLFVFEFAGQLHSQNSDALATTLRQLSSIQVGGMALVVIAIAAATMLSQAFAFSAIRWLEGYWGASSPALGLARARSWRHARTRLRLARRHSEVLNQVWLEVLAAIGPSLAASKKDRPKIFGTRTLGYVPPEALTPPPPFTSAMVAKLMERILGVKSGLRVSPKQANTVLHFEWEEYVARRTLHRLRSIEKRVQDYPTMASHVMPTRLGNVLRRSEDLTGKDDVEEFVERVFSKLPFDLQLAHDEERSRLDLYCSMTLVLWFAVIPASLAFYPSWEAWPICASAALLGSAICYSAALATARHYGAILVSIAETVPDD